MHCNLFVSCSYPLHIDASCDSELPEGDLLRIMVREASNILPVEISLLGPGNVTAAGRRHRQRPQRPPAATRAASENTNFPGALLRLRSRVLVAQACTRGAGPASQTLAAAPGRRRSTTNYSSPRLICVERQIDPQAAVAGRGTVAAYAAAAALCLRASAASAAQMQSSST